jgi:hypothetical protein
MVVGFSCSRKEERIGKKKSKEKKEKEKKFFPFF